MGSGKWGKFPMSFLVAPFEVSSAALAAPVKCRLVHVFPAIATRHSDTMDCVFRVDGQEVTVAISCAALTNLREREHHYFTDQQLAEIAALFLRRTLANGYDATQAELPIGETELLALGRELGYL